MSRWKCTCSYDGTNYFGWQSQKRGQASVQSAIEGGLERIFKTKVPIHGSGRTDAGVHAREQVFHFDFAWKHGAERLLAALGTAIPRDVQITSVSEVEESFHARFSARSKRYHYRLFLGNASPFDWPYSWSVPENVDLNQIQEALPGLLGEKDFVTFASNRGEEYGCTVRTMYVAEIYQKDGFVYLAFEANGFMYKMVRSLVGSLVNVGLRRLSVAKFREIVDSGTREPLILAGPPQGLFLEKVFY